VARRPDRGPGLYRHRNSGRRPSPSPPSATALDGLVGRTIRSTTATALVTQLRSAPGGGAPSDHFAGANTLAIVVQIDRALVTAGGSTVAVWASTNK